MDSDKYCEWKGEWLDKNKWEYITDCGQKVIVTKDNKYFKLLQAEYETCPFCKKEITQYSYD
jgi:hypothetical protein